MTELATKRAPAIPGIPDWITCVIAVVAIAAALTASSWFPWGGIAQDRNMQAARVFIGQHQQALLALLSSESELNLGAHSGQWPDGANKWGYLSIHGRVSSIEEAQVILRKIEIYRPPTPVGVDLLIGSYPDVEELDIEWLDGDPATDELSDLTR